MTTPTEKMGSWKLVRSTMLADLDRWWTADELAAATGLSKANVYKAISARKYRDRLQREEGADPMRVRLQPWEVDRPKKSPRDFTRRQRCGVARCEACGSESHIISSRMNLHSIRRRRVCVDCGARWSTVEMRVFEPSSFKDSQGMTVGEIAVLAGMDSAVQLVEGGAS